MFRLVSAYSLSQNTIESAEISRLFHLPNQPNRGRKKTQARREREREQEPRGLAAPGPVIRL
jgi:hypothetical protein